MEYVELEMNKIEVFCSYRIDVGVEIILFFEFNMYGIWLVYEGMIVGVCDLFVLFGVVVDFYLII